MNKNSKYVIDIQSRSKTRFTLGVMARIKNYIVNRYIIHIARKNGATIGEHVSLPLELAKKANANLIIGNHSSVQTCKLDLRAPIIIGNYVIIGSNVEIITCSHIVDSPDWEHKSYGIVIEDYVWIATNVLILPSCREIKNGAVIAAGSVAAKNVDSMQIVSGNPSTFLRLRTEVHFNLCVESLMGNDLITYLKARRNQI